MKREQTPVAKMLRVAGKQVADHESLGLYIRTIDAARDLHYITMDTWIELQDSYVTPNHHLFNQTRGLPKMPEYR